MSHVKHVHVRGRKVLLFVHEFKEQHDYSPSTREIMAAVDVSTTSVLRYHMQGLKKLGLMEFNDGEPRTCRLTDLGKMFVKNLLASVKHQTMMPVQTGSVRVNVPTLWFERRHQARSSSVREPSRQH